MTSTLKSRFTKTLAAGVLFLIPLTVLGYTLSKAFGVLRKLVEPLVEKLDVERVAGVLILDAMTVAALLACVFLLGLVAYLPRISGRIKTLDRRLSENVAGYMVVKGVVSGALEEEDEMSGFKTVVVSDGDTAQLGFEIERTAEGLVVVFMPDTPSPRTGSTMMVLASNVERLDIAPHKAMEMMKFFGKGLGDVLAQPRPEALPAA